MSAPFLTYNVMFGEEAIMEVSGSIDEVRIKINAARKAGKRIGFVPTMGFLHEGHLSLVDISKRESEYQVMSIFVNKMQFNDPKDYTSYPRELQRDLDMAQSRGVDLVFTPTDEAMYKDPLTYVDMNSLTDFLCGAHRPGHFRGVFTVVSKLFNIVQPDVSVFGQKDIQQVTGIEKMVADLNFPIKIIVAPIMRESDGLAMSSRNKHLNADNRANATVIYKSLQKAEALLNQGTFDSKDIINQMKKIIKQGKPKSIDYISLVDYSNLAPISKVSDKCVIAVAAFFGPTRLIDNMIISKTNGGYKCVY